MYRRPQTKIFSHDAVLGHTIPVKVNPSQPPGKPNLERDPTWGSGVKPPVASGSKGKAPG